MKNSMLWFTAVSIIAVQCVSGIEYNRQLTPQVINKYTTVDGRVIELEKLGMPLGPAAIPVEFVTKTGDDKIAWGVQRGVLEHAIIGYGEKTGKHWVELTQYYGPHSYKPNIAAVGDYIYIIAGNLDAHILKYHIPTKTTVVVKKLQHYYWQGHAVAPDGKIYFGVHPTAEVICLNPKTDEITNLGRITDDKEQVTASSPAVDDDEILYVPIGTKRTELYSFDLKTKEKKQLLSPEQSAIVTKNSPSSNIPRVMYINGKVYCQVGDVVMLCGKNGLTPTAMAKIGAGWTTNAKFPDRFMSENDSEIAIEFNEQGLVLAKRNSYYDRRTVPFEYRVTGPELYGVSAIKDNKLFGGGIFPAILFSVDLTTLKAADFGRISRGTSQIYDSRFTPKGLLITSYSGGYVDLFDPEQPEKNGTNPKPVAALREFAQDRPERITPTGDGSICYIASIPQANNTQGAISKVDLNSGEVKVWRGIMGEHSILDLVEIPGTKLLFGGTTIQDSINRNLPNETDSKLFIFDPEKEKVVWTGNPTPQSVAYQGTMVTGDKKLMVIARRSGNYQWIVLDPVSREVINSGELVAGGVKRRIFAHPYPAGPEGKNYFACVGSLWEYSPKTGKVTKLMEHKTLDWTSFITVSNEGYLYYVNESNLYRVKVF